MNALTLKIDTYKMAQILKSKGFTKEQTDGIIEVAREIDMESIVTRDYLDTKLTLLEQRLTIRLGSMIMALGAILVAIKYLG